MKSSEPSPREYHAQREAERLQQRERLRQSHLAEARTAVQQLAPDFPTIQAVYLFGSLLQVGRFSTQSDIDVAVACDDVDEQAATESAFWRALEEALEWNVDVRPYQGTIIQAVADHGEQVYARESAHSRT